ncbi:MAG: TrmJ/YjtD family RNA methyltransferase [Caldilinea sp.]|nr:TrmJ/YjtD family RNA methyltransferase [Caldilinea sp.]MDW8440706.1 TrmJ/YjtD family RNA methyltransferase [Caldilineaceae bacterium]
MFPDFFERVIVILHRPENPVNIGAVVRAMKNMGFTRLRLVQPTPHTAADLLRIAHHAEDVIERIEYFNALDAALADAHFVVGTAAIHHPDYRTTDDVRTLAPELLRHAATGNVALLFGPEADGLDRAALDRCHLVASMPTNPAYPALNLAQSALLFLYELRMAAGCGEKAFPSEPRATQAELERLFSLSEEALHAIDFFKYNPAAVMRTLRQIAYRAALRPDEVALLLAIARQILRAASRRGASSSAEG